MHVCPCMCVCVCVPAVLVSHEQQLRCGPSSGGCQSMVSSLPFIAQRVTAGPLVISTSEPSLSAPFAPRPRPPHPSDPPPSPSPVPSPVCRKHAVSRQTRQRLTDIHTHTRTRRHFQPTWARFWAGSEAHGTARPCKTWPWRSRCVQMCVCLRMCAWAVVCAEQLM